MTRRETLINSLRTTAAQLRDLPVRDARALSEQVIAAIQELQAQPTAQPLAWCSTIDPATIPTEVLLSEIARRTRQIRKVKKLCEHCGKSIARAKGLCLRCYGRKRAGKLAPGYARIGMRAYMRAECAEEPIRKTQCRMAGRARWAEIAPEQRSEQMLALATARWAKKTKEQGE